MRPAKTLQLVFLPCAFLFLLVIAVSGCDTTALVNRFYETRASLESHGIKVSHGKVLCVFRF